MLLGEDDVFVLFCFFFGFWSVFFFLSHGYGERKERYFYVVVSLDIVREELLLLLLLLWGSRSVLEAVRFRFIDRN